FPFDTLEACRARCEPRSGPAPAAPSARLALAHRADDGRVFVELPGGEALEPPQAPTPVCASARCGFRLWTGPSADEANPEPVFVVRPDGQLCEGSLGQRVALGKLDPSQSAEPASPEDATWSRGALVRG